MTSTSHEMEQPSRGVARVFFTYDDEGHLVTLRGLELSNHMENVAQLARAWDYRHVLDGETALLSALSATRPWLIRAAERHDEGKVRRFKIIRDRNHHNRPSYSFAGHRFEVIDTNPYIHWLIRLHHEFSVEGITEAQARLKMRSAMPENRISPQAAAQCFPLDLYTLEMCDQIEAEASTWLFDPPLEGKAPLQRAFMEYEIDCSAPIGEPLRLRVHPYPFGEQTITLRFRSFVVAAPDIHSQVTDSDLHLLKDAVLKAPVVKEESKEVVLCRFN